MDILSILIMIGLWAFISAAAKKNKQQRNSSRQSRPTGNTAPAAAPRRNAQAAAPAKPRQTTVDEAKKRLEKAKSVYTPVTAPKAEGEGSDVSSKEHTVRPSFAPGAHAHEETSMTGFKSCPPEKTAAAKKPVAAPVAEPAVPVSAPPVPAFAFTREEAIRAIVYSEILSKPKALR